MVPLLPDYDSIEHPDLYMTGVMARWTVMAASIEASIGMYGNAETPSKLRDVLNIADDYVLSEDTYVNHILKRHGSDSLDPRKSHFLKGFNIKEAIDILLKGDDFFLFPNTSGRGGYIFEKVFDEAIGMSKSGKLQYILKVVIDELGNVITAFPK